ncbi:MAG: hypothetical protein LC117_09160 [Bacteroidia bacterium]|nr:hypothetical protein [Bacteroidia bacterium]MCZ2278081.1 hypothetical protein [Bacteroidia bacterium]
MKIKLARYIPVIFHPLLMPFYATIFIYNIHSYLSYSLASEVKTLSLVFIFTTCFIAPVITALWLVQKGWIHSLEMAERKERSIPFLSTVIYYIACYLLIRLLPVPSIVASLILGGAFLIAVAFMINLKWKISIHLIGLGGLSGLIWITGEILIADIIGYFILSLLAAGLVGWSRLFNEAHTPLQVYTGYITGFLGMIFILRLLL